MMPSVAMVAVAVLLTWAEATRLRKRRMKKELRVCIVLMVAATMLGIAEIWQFPLPNPIDWLFRLFKPIDNAVRQLLT